MSERTARFSGIRRGILVTGLAVVLAVIVAFVTADLVRADETGQTPQQVGSLRQNIAVVEKQINEKTDQQSRERAIGKKILGALPAGASYAPEEELTELEEQRSALRAAEPDMSPDNLVVNYEEGYFTSLLALDWQCAWISEAVVRAEKGDQSGVNAALETLWSFEDSELISSFPDYARKLNDLAVPLKNGNVAYTKRYLAENCMPETLVY